MGTRQDSEMGHPMEQIPQQNQRLMSQQIAPVRQTSLNNNHPLLQQQQLNSAASVTKATTVKNNVNLRKNSLITQRKNNALQIEFMFDTTVECKITIYIMALEIQRGSVTDHYQQKFTFKHYNVELTQAQLQQLTKYRDYDVLFPLVIEITSLQQIDSQFQSHAQITYAAFNSDHSVRILKQKILVGSRSYEIHEIFGVEQKQSSIQDQVVQEEGLGKECVICYSEYKDTTVIPCRHMCLCGNCANIVRSQPNAKCPICRTPVQSLLQVKIDGMSTRLA